MTYGRFLMAFMLLLCVVPNQATSLAQNGGASPDLPAIPLTPDELGEPGYLLEGGGFIEDGSAVGSLIGSLTRTEIDAPVGNNLQRSYMHRLILLFDRLDPGSELLADEITLVHQFATAKEADRFAISLLDSFDEIGERPEFVDGIVTHRLVVESANSLVSTFVVDHLVIQVISTELTGRPDEALHADAVINTLQSAEQALSDAAVGLSSLILAIDDITLTTFADAPESHQHYQVANDTWIPSVDFTAADTSPTELGIEQAFESQQIVTLNTGDTIVFQTWIALFENDLMAKAFAETLPLEELPTVIFFDQADRNGEGPFALRGTLDDGRRYGGYRDVVQDGVRVAVVAVIASGNQYVTEEQIARFAELQASCLQSPDHLCVPILASDVLGEESTATTEPPASDGIYTDARFGWSVDYEAAGWEYLSLEAGVMLELQHGRSLASIEPVVNRHGDPTQCLLEEVRLLETLEEHAYITLGSDVEDEPMAGNEAGHVWSIYTVEPLADERADQEYTIRIDCYALIEGEASLVVHHSAPRDLWDLESAKGEDLRANIDLSEVAAAASEGVDAQVRIVEMMIPRIWIPRAA